MSWTVVGTVLGGAIGSAIPGAGMLVGAEWGSAIGTVIDALTAKPPSVFGDAHYSSVAYGSPIGRVFGTGRIDCAAIWVARNGDGTYMYEVDESTGKKGGKKGGGGSVPHYFTNWAIAIAETGFTFPDGTQLELKLTMDRIWMADQIVWQSATAIAIPAWSSSHTFAYGDYCTDGGLTYRSLGDDNLNNDPTANQGSQPPATSTNNWWQLVQTSSTNISLVEHPGPSESTFTMAVDSAIASHDGVDNVQAWRGLHYAKIKDQDLFYLGNTIPSNVSCECHTTHTDGSALTDGDFISIMCRLAGLSVNDIDVTDCTDTLEGVVIQSDGTAQEALTNFLLAKSYDLVEGPVLKFKKRGSDPVLTINANDTGSAIGSDSPETSDSLPVSILADRRELHSTLQLGYRDVSTGFRQTFTPSNRQDALWWNPAKFDTGLSLQPLAAAQMAAKLIDTEWLEAGREFGPINLPPTYDVLSPADVVLATFNGVLTRFRITKTDWQLGMISLYMVRDEAYVLDQSQIVNVPDTANSGTAGGNGLIVATAFSIASHPYDLTPDLAAYPGVYVFANGQEGWGGCTIWYTFDAPVGSDVFTFSGRDWVQAGFINSKSAFGPIVTDVLPSETSPGVYTQSTHFQPQVGATMDIPSVSAAQVGQGYNVGYIGEEIVGIITTADPTGTPKTQQITSVYRGLNGTPMPAHSLGEILQMCMGNSTGAVGFEGVAATTPFKIKLKNSDVGRTIYVQALSTGQTINDSVELSCTVVANTSPYTPNTIPPAPDTVAVASKAYNGFTETVNYLASYNTPPTTALTFNWETSTDGGTTWATSVNSGGSFSSPGFTSGTMLARCQATNAAGQSAWVNSTSTTYSVPVIAQEPVDPTSIQIAPPSYISTTEYLVFTPVVPSTAGAQNYEWQTSTNGGSTWSSSTFGQTLNKSFTSGSIEARVRAVVSGGNGNWITSSNTTYSAPTLIVAPVDPTSVQVSVPAYSSTTESLTFTPIVPSTAGAQNYEWQTSTDGGSTWGSSTYGQSYTQTFTSGTLEVRVRAVTTGGNGSWVASANKTYVAPPTSGGTWSEDEVPSGSVDGVNTTFVFTHTPLILFLYLYGLKQQEGVHYTRSGGTVTFTTAPAVDASWSNPVTGTYLY